MRISMRWKRGAVFLFVAVCYGSAAPAETEPQDIKVADPFKYTRIYTDDDGVSHFGVAEVAFTLAEYAPPAPPISVSKGMKVESVVFITSPPGWHGDWHPVPRRQIMFCLAGELEVQVSDGMVRTFGPGSVLLVEDTEGKGHVSRVVGSERVFMAALPMEAISQNHISGEAKGPGSRVLEMASPLD
jgi:quercetin dioxygenase-like cupin family protein